MSRAKQAKGGEPRSLNDRAFDLVGEMLLERETHALLQEIAAEQAGGNTADYDAFRASKRAENLQKIETCLRKARAKRYVKPLIRAGQVAAIVLLTIAIAGVAVANIEFIRVRVFKLLAVREAEYTSLRLEENEDASFDVPVQWEGENYPSFIPDGMHSVFLQSMPGYSIVQFMDDNDAEISFSFSELGEDAEANIDSENAHIRPVMISGHPGFVVEKEKSAHIYWSNGKKYFIISANNLDTTAVERIANSVMRVY